MFNDLLSILVPCDPILRDSAKRLGHLDEPTAKLWKRDLAKFSTKPPVEIEEL